MEEPRVLWLVGSLVCSRGSVLPWDGEATCCFWVGASCAQGEPRVAQPWEGLVCPGWWIRKEPRVLRDIVHGLL